MEEQKEDKKEEKSHTDDQKLVERRQALRDSRSPYRSKQHSKNYRDERDRERGYKGRGYEDRERDYRDRDYRERDYRGGERRSGGRKHYRRSPSYKSNSSDESCDSYRRYYLGRRKKDFATYEPKKRGR